MFNTCVSILAVLILLSCSGCGGGGNPTKDKPVASNDDEEDDSGKTKKTAPKSADKVGTPKASGPVTAYDVKNATGTIKGVVKFDGKPPTMAKLVMADPQCPHNREGLGDLMREDLVVKDGAIANAVVYVSKGQEKYNFEAMTMPDAVIDQHGCQYHPHILALKTEQALDIKSSDTNVAHNIHIIGPESGKEVNVSQPQPGVHSTHPKFSTPELGVIVKCDVHSWMKAFICVFDHPFYAVTKDDGTFEIKLPPGEYELSVWHESGEKYMAAPAAEKVTVAGDKPSDVTLTFKGK